MRRRNWFLALFAPQVVAQEKPEGVKILPGQTHLDLLNYRVNGVEVIRSKPSGNTFLGKAIPTNNECPVCGTMANPFTVPKSDKCAIYTDSMPVFTIPSSMLPACPPEVTLAVRPYTQNITRCAHCNCAFWQDAE